MRFPLPRLRSLCLPLLFAVTALSSLQAASVIQVPIPTRHEVGAACLPEALAPIQAPFPMPALERPVFPKLVVSIVEKGAQADVLCTREIQAAIDEVHQRGGGRVLIPSGDWQTGRLILKSNVDLHIEAGARVYFSGRVEDYQPAVFTRNEGVEVMSLGALIYANGLDNIAITGKGTLIGPPLDCAIRRQVMKSDVVENVLAASTPVAERVYTGLDGGPVFLPMFISPTHCTRVLIEGVTLERTAFWNIVPVYCDGVIIRGVTVNSVGIPRGDGIDIESTRNVLIEYSTLNCGDDCFTMKAGRGEDGLRVGRPTENVVVRHCLAREGHGGITLGSETAGMIRNLYLHDCVFDGTGTGIRFKTRRPRGGGGENVILERIRMDLTGTAVTADMLGAAMYVGELASRLPERPVNALTPSFGNVTIRDIIVGSASQFIKITGIPESPFRNLVLENAEVSARTLIRISDARDLTLRNLYLKTEKSQIELLDVDGLLFDRVQFDAGMVPLTLKKAGERTQNIRFVGCTPNAPEASSR